MKKNDTKPQNDQTPSSKSPSTLCCASFRAAPTLPQYSLSTSKDDLVTQFIEENLYKEDVTMKVGHIPTEIKRGTTLLSFRQIEEGTKLSPKSVRCAIKRLVEYGEITAEAKGSRYTVFSLHNRSDSPAPKESGE